MSTYAELDNLTLHDLIARWRAPAPEGPEYADAYYGEVAARLREQGPAGVAFLLRQREEGDETRWRAALLGLTLPPRLPDPALRDLLLDALDDPRPAIVAEAIDGLWNQGCDDARERVLPLRDHPAPHVRAAVLRYMSHLHPDDARPLLLAALRDPNPLVRENAIDELDELGADDALPAIRLLLDDPDPRVRQAARTAMADAALPASG